jgi:hypothetical protein
VDIREDSLMASHPKGKGEQYFDGNSCELNVKQAFLNDGRRMRVILWSYFL